MKELRELRHSVDAPSPRRLVKAAGAYEKLFLCSNKTCQTAFRSCFVRLFVLVMDELTEQNPERKPSIRRLGDRGNKRRKKCVPEIRRQTFCHEDTTGLRRTNKHSVCFLWFGKRSENKLKTRRDHSGL